MKNKHLVYSLNMPEIDTQEIEFRTGNNNTEMKQEKLFREGDRVYSAYYQRSGTIDLIFRDTHGLDVRVKFDEGANANFTTCGRQSLSAKSRDLSFTKYDYINGGFSQERKDEGSVKTKTINFSSYNNYELSISHFQDELYNIYITNGIINVNVTLSKDKLNKISEYIHLDK